MGYTLKVEELEMNPDLERRFDAIDKHLDKQDNHHSEAVRTFNEHVLVDKEIHTKVVAHLDACALQEANSFLMKVAKVGGILAIVAALLGVWYADHLQHKETRAGIEQIKVELKK